MSTNYDPQLVSEVPASNDEAWAWSVFWRSDQLQSCMPESESADRNSIASIWQEFFSSLPPGARILDLGSGNGSVAVHAVAVSRQKSSAFSIHGADLADIDPAQFVKGLSGALGEITFHPRTSMEDLPFTDEHFDAITSQYALEYSQLDTSLAEAMRVLRDQGLFRFLLHADDSVLKDRCALQLRQANTILASPLFPCLADVLQKVVSAERERTSQSLASAEASIAALTATIEELERGRANDEDRSLVDNLITAVRRIPDLRRSFDLPSLLAIANQSRELLIAQASRLQAMGLAALDETAARKLLDQIRASAAADAKLERATAGDNENCVGYWLYGKKAGPR